MFSYLNPETVRDVLVQALLDAPVCGVRWRWNATRALAVLRYRGGRRVPPQLQRMNADDLVSVVFPDQLACPENLAGDREVPDHPLVEQTLRRLPRRGDGPARISRICCAACAPES